MLTRSLYVLFLVAKSLQYDEPTKAQQCVVACNECFDELSFGTTTSTDDYYTGYCLDTLKWESTWLCSKLYCTSYQIMTGADYAGKPCRTEVHIDIPSYNAVIANYSSEALNAVPRIEYSPEPPTDIFNNTVVPSKALFDIAFKTVVCIHQLARPDSNVLALIVDCCRASGSMWKKRIGIIGM